MLTSMLLTVSSCGFKLAQGGGDEGESESFKNSMTPEGYKLGCHCSFLFKVYLSQPPYNVPRAGEQEFQNAEMREQQDIQTCFFFFHVVGVKVLALFPSSMSFWCLYLTESMKVIVILSYSWQAGLSLEENKRMISKYINLPSRPDSPPAQSRGRAVQRSEATKNSVAVAGEFTGKWCEIYCKQVRLYKVMKCNPKLKRLQ